MGARTIDRKERRGRGDKSEHERQQITSARTVRWQLRHLEHRIAYRGALRPCRYATTVLSACGLILMGIGIFFAVARPALLPEDARYLQMTATQIDGAVPRLARWLDLVFWVMGAYIFTTGLLTLFLARTSFRASTRGVWGVMTFAGLSSIGVMTIVNFLLVSDFRWLLVAPALLWATALVLFAMGK